jgi:hypothetical protein
MKTLRYAEDDRPDWNPSDSNKVILKARSD